jgi:hypothetical protein
LVREKLSGYYAHPDGDATLEDSEAGLAGRLKRLEDEVRDLRAAFTEGQAALRPATSDRSEEPAARATLDTVAPALPTLARQVNAPLAFFALATPRSAASSGPENLDFLAGDEHLPNVTALARLFADRDRLKLAQTLLLESGCSLTRLAGVSGTPELVVRAHLRALHAAGMVFEPSAESFQLTTNGEHATAMLFWSAWRASSAAPSEMRQEQWLESAEADPPTS